MTAPPVAPDLAVEHARARDEIAWIDAQLAAPVGRPGVRVCTYAAPAVVLGCSQPAGVADRLRADAAGVDIVVRQSGGGAVLAGPWMLGASIALPPAHPFSALPLAASYRWLGDACVRWLDAIGVASRSLPLETRAQTDGVTWARFARTSWWEVQGEGRKIAGFAQVRRRHGVVFTAGVLLGAPPWPLLCAVLGKPPADAAVLAAGTVGVEELSGRPVQGARCAAELGGYIVRAIE